MTLEGDLGDVSLAGLIQLMGTRRRSGGIALKRLGQTGLVYFVDGQIVDAAAGARRGEEALYELLGWDQASFAVRRELRPSGRSIWASWNQLLLDGMRRIDEGKYQDETEDDFVALMSALEQVFVKLRDPKGEATLALYGEMVNQVTRFWDALPEVAGGRARLPRLVAEVARDHPAARLIEAEERRLPLEKLEVLARTLPLGPAEPREPAEPRGPAELSVPAACAALLEVLNRFLELVVQRFRSPELREHWSQTCTCFVQEVRANLELAEH